MEKRLLLEKLEAYKLMKQHIEEGVLPVDVDQKIQMIEKEIEDLRAQQDELRKMAKSEMDADLTKVNHYIELLEELIDEAPMDDEVREDVEEPIDAPEEVVQEDLPEDIPMEDDEKIDEIIDEPIEQVEKVDEIGRQETSRFPSFNIR